jgi:N-acetylmuramoyl-L-alanine amidase
VGYHYVIEGDGSVRRGRAPNTMGAHAKGANSDSIGICIVGDNTRHDRKWTVAQRKSAAKLITSLRMVWGHLPLRMHREVGTTDTECPGLDSLPATLET